MSTAWRAPRPRRSYATRTIGFWWSARRVSSGSSSATLSWKPAARSTAPALTLAALRLTELGPRSADRAAMLVMPADHVVSDVDAFRRAVSAAYGPAAEGRIVAFGVVPTSPETGYGYIRADARTESSGQGRTQTDRRIVEFVEKPDAQTALRYLHSGDYLWNSGIFIMRRTSGCRSCAAFGRTSWSAAARRRRTARSMAPSSVRGPSSMSAPPSRLTTR